MTTKTKACIACAESIQPAAKLCKHCGTWQDDKRFIAVKSKLSPRRPNSETVTKSRFEFKKNESTGKINFVVSWWAQLIVVFIVLVNPRTESFSSPYVLFLNIGGQLIGWNILITLAFTIAWLVIRKKSPNTNILLSWLFSSLCFAGAGLLIMTFTLASLAITGR